MENEERVRDLLQGELVTEIKGLSKLNQGSKEHSEAVDSVTKLYKIIIEETENDRALRERSDRDIIQEREWQLKLVQSRRESVGQYVKIAVDVAGVIVPVIVYSVWMGKGFKFEQTGTFTSTTFRNFFSRLNPFRLK